MYLLYLYFIYIFNIVFNETFKIFLNVTHTHII